MAGSVLLIESDVATAVRAMQLGAENFLTKPVDMEHLAAATARVADKARLRRVNEALLVQSAPGHGHAGLRPPGGAAGPERTDHRPAHRRERHRQGLGRADDPRPEPAGPRPV